MLLVVCRTEVFFSSLFHNLAWGLPEDSPWFEALKTDHKCCSFNVVFNYVSTAWRIKPCLKYHEIFFSGRFRGKTITNKTKRRHFHKCSSLPIHQYPFSDCAMYWKCTPEILVEGGCKWSEFCLSFSGCWKKLDHCRQVQHGRNIALVNLLWPVDLWWWGVHSWTVVLFGPSLL